MLVVLDEAKKLEEFVLVFLWDSYACVNHWNFQEVISLVVLNYFNFGLNWTFLREFKSVPLKSIEYLHNSVLVTTNKWAYLFSTLTSNVNVLSFELQILVIGFLALNAHDFFNSFLNVEHLIVFSKFMTFYLREIKEILNYKVH